MSLELKEISKKIDGQTHIYPTSLTLEPGSFNVLLGTTLSGKTTLMQLMAGLEKPTSGRLFFNGVDVTDTKVQKRNVSMVYQQFINYPNFNVFDNIASPLRVAGLSDAEIKNRVGRFAELLRLSPMLQRKPSELSGGQQQRIAIARSLVKDSELILLDEPLANLDFKLREELRDELPKLFAEKNCVVVYATTEPVEALLFGGHTAALHEGRVTQFGTTSSIYREPDDLISAKVFSEPPINTANVQKQGAEFVLADTIRWKAPDALAGLPDDTYIMGLRPHLVGPQAGGKQSVQIDGEVLIAELSGSESILHFTFDGNIWVSLAHGVSTAKIGEQSSFHADVSDAFYFHADGKRIRA